MIKGLKKKIAALTAAMMVVTLSPVKSSGLIGDSQTTVLAEATTQKRLMVGYWHNFDNKISKVIKLREVNNNWDVINVSFGITDAAKDKATIIFSVDPEVQTETEFISDVKLLQGKGKKIVLSLGGQYGEVLLNSATDKDKFVKSVSSIVDKYGFNGLDLDLEQYMSATDDFKNPKLPQNIYMIQACKELKAKYGSNFLLTMAPETAYVQGLLVGGSGGYLPLIHNLRNELDYVAVQLYNSGPMSGSDGNPYQQGTVDFVVAMSEMLLNGFEVGWGSKNMFPALREDQVLIGLPACSEAAPNGGYLSNDDLNKAILALTKGQTYGGRYKMQNSNGYPNLRGVMSWSTNWDDLKGFSFSNNARKTLDSLPVVENTLQSGSISTTAPTNKAYSLTVTIPGRNTATSYEVFENTTSIDKGTLTAGTSSPFTKTISITNKADGTYNYKVIVKDASGASLTSAVCTVTLTNGGGTGGETNNNPPGVKEAQPIGNKMLMVGYWHNFDNGTGFIKLKDVNRKWDVYNISFGEAPGDNCTIQFKPEYDDASFIADVQLLHKEGKRIVLSIGGQNGVVHLDDDAKTQKFIDSCSAIIDKYGFDGLDIDIENGISLLAGDKVDAPVNPRLVNVIKAIKAIKAKYGSNFIISSAPEVPYVQQGYQSYAGISGAYLPIINGIRDELSYIHVQYYNNGIPQAPDGSTYGTAYERGTADSLVAMTDMLINGFPLSYGSAGYFKGLRPDQVMFGLPGSPGNTAAPSGGYVEPSEVIKAIKYIIGGEKASFGGKAKLSNSAGYPGFRGVMAWSVNWDTKYNETFSTTVGNYVHSITPAEPSLMPALLNNSEVANQGYTITATIPGGNSATSYKLYEGSTIIDSNTLKVNDVAKTITKSFTNKPLGTYNYKIVLQDAAGKTVETTLTVIVSNTPVKPGVPDVNSDGNIDATDLALVAAKYNSNYGEANYDAKCDMNADGTIDIYDLVKVASKMLSQEEQMAWKAGVSYKVGDIVTYNGKKYKCTVAHTSIETWYPTAVPAIWQEI